MCLVRLMSAHNIDYKVFMVSFIYFISRDQFKLVWRVGVGWTVEIGTREVFLRGYKLQPT